MAHDSRTAADDWLRLQSDPPQEPVISRNQYPSGDAIDSLLEAIIELTAAVHELKDHFLLEQWHRQHGVRSSGPFQARPGRTE